MALPNDALHTPAAGLFPEFEQIELLAGQLPDTPFDQLVSKLASGSRCGGWRRMQQRDSRGLHGARGQSRPHAGHYTAAPAAAMGAQLAARRSRLPSAAGALLLPQPQALSAPPAPAARRLDTQLYFFANQDQLLHVAKLLSKVPQLALSDR